MRVSRYLSAFVLVILLTACLLAYYYTGDAAKPATPQNNSAAAEQSLVDTSLLQTALKLLLSAATPDEQAQAREAWRLADHELDLAFAAALREPCRSRSRVARQRPAAAIERLASTGSRRALRRTRSASNWLGKDDGDALDLAQAQLDLDQDELDDAQQDLARAGRRQTGQAPAPAAGARSFGQGRRPGRQVRHSRRHRNHERTASRMDVPRRLRSPVAGRRATGCRARPARCSIEHNTLERQLPTQPDAGGLRGRHAATVRQHKTLSRPRPAHRGRQTARLPSISAGARSSKTGGARSCIWCCARWRPSSPSCWRRCCSTAPIAPRLPPDRPAPPASTAGDRPHYAAGGRRSC